MSLIQSTNKPLTDKGMIMFDEHHHTFVDQSKRAEVWKDEKGNWGCRFWDYQVWKGDRLFEGHSEQYAENAAENYVLGILEL
tara:strand:+ start:167 stop:412 length:246 start_codon:yes stop_codon:yes gene_type:complete